MDMGILAGSQIDVIGHLGAPLTKSSCERVRPQTPGRQHVTEAF
mgnify:CR=1 FL=1